MPASLASRRASGEEKTRSPWPLALRGAALRPAAARARLQAAARRLRRWLRRPAAAAAALRRLSAARPRRWRRRRGRLHVLAVAGQHRDDVVDRHVLRAFRHQDLRDRALVDRLDLHGRLVGLDLGDDVAGLDLVAFLLQPLGEVALLHRGRQRGHQDVDGHQALGGFDEYGRRPARSGGGQSLDVGLVVIERSADTDSSVGDGGVSEVAAMPNMSGRRAASDAIARSPPAYLDRAERADTRASKRSALTVIVERQPVACGSYRWRLRRLPDRLWAAADLRCALARQPVGAALRIEARSRIAAQHEIRR